MSDVNVMQKAAEAAKKVGAVCPEAVAEYLKDRLSIVDTAAGPQIVVNNGLVVEPIEAVMARLQVTEGVGALFNGGKPDIRTMSHELYAAIRKHNPELLGLRPNRR
jgi:hypothetical protein